MEVKIIEEHGFEAALYGLSLSFKDRAVPYEEWWTKERFEKLTETSKKIYKKDGGHNKFLEAMVVWLDLEAPRGWWQEFDTYRVGTSKQSESTMHTIQFRPFRVGDFEEHIDPIIMDRLNVMLIKATDSFSSRKVLRDEDLHKIKAHLPEGYLQRRVVCLNYKVLRNMFIQRRTHRLDYWKLFIAEVTKQAKYPELLEIK